MRLISLLAFAAVLFLLPHAVSAEDSAVEPDVGSTNVYEVDVEGMACAFSCAPKVQAALKSIEGVADVRIDLAKQCATVTMQSKDFSLTEGEAKSALEEYSEYQVVGFRLLEDQS